MEATFAQFKREQQAQVAKLVAQPDDLLRQHELLEQATQIHLLLLLLFAHYPPAVALRMELAEVVDTALPAVEVGQHLLRLLA